MKTVLFLNHNQEYFGTYYRCLNLATHVSKKYKVIMLCASAKSLDLHITTKSINRNFTIITLPRVKIGKYFTGQIILRLPLYIYFTLVSKYDICHAFTVAQPQIAIPAIISKLFKNKKLVIDWDDCWGDGFASQHGLLVSKILNLSEIFTLKFSDHITYVSDFLKKRLNKIVPLIPKTKIINGCNPQLIKPLDKNTSKKLVSFDINKKYILSIGNTYTKSLFILLNAFKKVLKTNNSTLVFVGSLDIPIKYKKLFNSIKKNIIQVGTVPYKQIPTYMSASDALILPMENNNIEKARFPMRFGDYLCAQKPIVSNAVGEVKYFLDKYKAGLTSPPTNSKKMAQNIIRAITTNQSVVAKNARVLAETDLNWQNITRKLTKIYENINS